jgi:hypothetical protein
MDIQPLEILKWIGIVLAAGFVGYFGRYLAMVIINRLRRKIPEKGSVAGTVAEDRQPAIVMNDNSHKIEKKKAKAVAKRAKKAGRS